ncbi:MAG: hypothetical protein K6F05_05790 [Succinivibrio sp.]|nr:hypothetical protein [Succinivibrio sp.]
MSTSDSNQQSASKPEEPVVKEYVCKICGYVYVGNLDDEPDDYVCPMCRKGKEYFEEKV